MASSKQRKDIDLPPEYHPRFDAQDADIVLRSSEGTLYRIPSFVLRTTTRFFRSMLESDQHRGDIIPIDAKDIVLERLLRIISGLEIPRWESYEVIEDVAALAECWDALGALSIICSAITAPFFLTEPLRLYVIATRLGWEEEAKLASKQSLSLSLYTENNQTHLQRLPSKHLLALLNLHRSRRDRFKEFFDSEEAVASPAVCICSETRDNHTWRELKAAMFLEMDERPLGDTLMGKLSMEGWPVAVACWGAKCTKEGCGELLYNRAEILRKVKSCIESLPVTV